MNERAEWLKEVKEIDTSRYFGEDCVAYSVVYVVF